mmetsp:Transcript_2180/g.4896  ORF Transcript_2180/g.4896 Transcript_2180/m.4896 type:complete len:264 (+) Transcript_2180:686-1477(+)
MANSVACICAPLNTLQALPLSTSYTVAVRPLPSTATGERIWSSTRMSGTLCPNHRGSCWQSEARMPQPPLPSSPNTLRVLLRWCVNSVDVLITLNTSRQWVFVRNTNTKGRSGFSSSSTSPYLNAFPRWALSRAPFCTSMMLTVLNPDGGNPTRTMEISGLSFCISVEPARVSCTSYWPTLTGDILVALPFSPLDVLGALDASSVDCSASGKSAKACINHGVMTVSSAALWSGCCSGSGGMGLARLNWPRIWLTSRVLTSMSS